MNLTQLAAKHGTDKCGPYTDFYERLLGGRLLEKVVEIGIGTTKCMGHVPCYQPGASLRMWQEYFPTAEIYALDIDETVLVNVGRIRSRRCDQSNEGNLRGAAEWVGNNCDLILDDGSHDPHHQVQTVKWFLPRLASHGIYIIEDVIDPFAVSKGLNELHVPHAHISFHGQREDRLTLIYPRSDSEAVPH